MQNNKTHWNTVAAWYDEYLARDDTYQEKVIAPNLLRMLAPKNDEHIFDVACGEGYFARRVAQSGATVTGIDQAQTLILSAKERGGERETYILGDVQKLQNISIKKVDVAYCVLAFENIKNISSVMEGIASKLSSKGRMVLVLLHPAFRTPKYTDWGYDMKRGVQYRKIEKYLSEIAIPIELAPFKGKKKETTVTFHRSLQWYMKAFRNAGFAITNIEEWVSHKKSALGPRQNAEDAARKEIPMFLAIELRKN